MKYPPRRSLQNRDTVSLPVSRHHLRRIRLPNVPLILSGRLGHRAVAPTMKLTVNGGTLISTETTYNQAVYSYSYGNDMKNVLINVSGGTFNGDIALTGGANKTNLETLNISGGTFNGSYGFYSYGADEKALEAITVTGGTFPEDPSAYLPTGYGAVETAGRWNVVAAE